MSKKREAKVIPFSCGSQVFSVKNHTRSLKKVDSRFSIRTPYLHFAPHPLALQFKSPDFFPLHATFPPKLMSNTYSCQRLATSPKPQVLQLPAGGSTRTRGGWLACRHWLVRASPFGEACPGPTGIGAMRKERKQKYTPLS